MKNTDEIQEAPGSGFLARPLHSKKKSEWCYTLRQITRSQRQGSSAAAQKAGGPKRPTPARRRGPRGDSLLSVDAGPQHSGRNQAGFQGSAWPIRISSKAQCAIPAGRWRSFRGYKVL